MTDSQESQISRPALGLALLAAVALIGGSFIAAHLTQHMDLLFALAPRVAEGVVVSPLDVISAKKTYAFHATIYTIWATMLLSLPAFCLVWFVRRDRAAHAYWLVFWTVGLIAMLVHQYLAMGVLFEWNWQHILSDTVRVTIPIPDLVLTVWWIVDVVLGWCFRRSQNVFMYAQRIVLHLALLVIFLIGFVREGEILLSRLIGITSGFVVFGAVVLGLLFYKSKSVESRG